MNCVLLILHGTLLLHSVVTFPPAPVNVSVDSHNFYHVLRWDPGPGTPPGTLYDITQRKEDEEKDELLTSNTTWLDLLLDDIHLEYRLTVQAFYNQTRSKKSKTIIFYPYRNTHIDPAEVSLSGCGNCIHVNISMPEPYWRSGIDDLYYYYFPKFTIYWRKADENPEKEICLETDDKSYTLRNLEMGREYCVKVDTKIQTNPNTKASAWKCAFTSPVVESRTGLARC